MKNGYKHKTGTPGKDSERYVGQLFQLFKKPDGDRRPDLVSVNGRYKPYRLTLEVKSGKKQKGVLVEHQLAYGITTIEDYEDLMHESSSRKDKWLSGKDWDLSAPSLADTPVAYYINQINRDDEITAEQLRKRFSAIQFSWGDQHIAPHQYGFFAFAVAKHMRTQEPLRDIISELKDGVRRRVFDEHSHYEEREKGPQSWQDIHARDYLSIFEHDPWIATRDGMKRRKLIMEFYPEVNDLERIVIPGPNDTNIYVMSEPEHKELFDVQLRKTVEEQKPVIEKISRQRQEALPLLGKITERHAESLFDNGDLPVERYIEMDLSRNEISLLERLTHWLDIGGEMVQDEAGIVHIDQTEYSDENSTTIDEEEEAPF